MSGFSEQKKVCNNARHFSGYMISFLYQVLHIDWGVENFMDFVLNIESPLTSLNTDFASRFDCEVSRRRSLINFFIWNFRDLFIDALSSKTLNYSESSSLLATFRQ